DDDPGRTATRVLVERVELREDGDLVLLRMVGSHFLWKMVRRVVGVIAEVGRGGMSVDEAGRLLHQASDAPARLTAPPSGLFLERVFYEGDAREHPLRSVLVVRAPNA